jgi:single-strand DNA-binding protein
VELTVAQLTTQITIAGNLTRDPELRYTQGGQPVASFSVASTPRSYNRETREYTDGEAIFTNCTLWGKPAENLAASLVKGARVIVAGTLKSRTYQSREGESKTATELVVDEMGASLLFATVDVHRGGSSGRGGAPAQATGGGADDIGAAMPYKDDDDQVPW